MANLPILLLLTFIGHVIGRYDFFPAQTVHANDYPDVWGWTPKPTAMPNPLGLMRRAELPPNSTCGFISGSSASVLTCNGGLDCGFNSKLNAAGCCTGYTLVGTDYTLNGCTFLTSCFDSTAIASECDPACQSASGNLVCSSSQYPYCMRWLFTDIGYTVLDCNEYSNVVIDLGLYYTVPTTTSNSSTTPSSTTSSTTTPASTTSISPVVVGPTTTTSSSSTPSRTSSVSSSSSLSSSSTSSMSSSSTTFPLTPLSASSSTSADSSTAIVTTSSSTTPSRSSTSTSETTTSAAPVPAPTSLVTSSPLSSTKNVLPSPTANASSASAAATAFSTNGPTEGNVKSSTSHTGAIVGGAVGGVGGLAILAGLIWFFLRRRRRNGNNVPEVSQNYPQYTPVSPQTQYSSVSPQQAHEFPSESSYTGNSHPYPQGYSTAPEVVQPGYRGVENTGGYSPEQYGRPYSEMP